MITNMDKKNLSNERFKVCESILQMLKFSVKRLVDLQSLDGVCVSEFKLENPTIRKPQISPLNGKLETTSFRAYAKNF